MKNRIILALLLLILVLASCSTSEKANTTEIVEEKIEHVDYTSLLSFQMDSNTAKQKVTVKSFIDGDTTHFIVPETISADGVLKARYLAINTPESTGKIEEWGKKASEFTKNKLKNATEIWIESDNSSWNLDSTGARYLVWVWYREGDGEFKNLNLEILQNGLAIPSSSANNRYGSYCQNAISQARSEKLNVWSGEKDPDFFYGDAIEIALKELRANVEEYNGKKVAFEGVVTRNYNNSIYIEDKDEESGMSYGISVYYGYSLTGAGLEIIGIGNRVRIVGTVQYYEGGDSYQVSGIKYRQMMPTDPDNIRLISSGHSGSYTLVTVDEINNGNVTFIVGDDTVTLKSSIALLDTTVEVKNLKVDSIYTTVNEDSSSNGAMTLYCSNEDGNIQLRTIKLKDNNGVVLTEKDYLGKTISVKGILEQYEGSIQIRVFNSEDITIE